MLPPPFFFPIRFPLYPKGGEKLQFEYGVYLLNKNIAQVGTLEIIFFYYYLYLFSAWCQYDVSVHMLSCDAALCGENL